MKMKLRTYKGTTPALRDSRRRKLKSKWPKLASGSELIKETIIEVGYPLITCSFSGGKDSLAATLLTLDCLQEFKEGRVWIVYNNTTNEFPETIRYVRHMLEWFKENYSDLELKTEETHPKKPFRELMEDMFFEAVRMYESGNWDKNKLVCCNVVKLDPIKKFLNLHTTNILISGIRGDESRQRFLILFKQGPKHRHLHHAIKSSPRMRKICPLWDWSSQDVMEYLKNHPKNPPINPLYSQGYSAIGCMLCPVPFIWNREEIRHTYPKKIFQKGMDLLRKAIERTGQTLLTSYLLKELQLETPNTLP